MIIILNTNRFLGMNSWASMIKVWPRATHCLLRGYPCIRIIRLLISYCYIISVSNSRLCWVRNFFSISFSLDYRLILLWNSGNRSMEGFSFTVSVSIRKTATSLAIGFVKLLAMMMGIVVIKTFSLMVMMMMLWSDTDPAWSIFFVGYNCGFFLSFIGWITSGAVMSIVWGWTFMVMGCLFFDRLGGSISCSELWRDREVIALTVLVTR